MAERKKKPLFYLGLHLIIASIVFGVVTYCYAEEYPPDGVYRSQDKGALIIRLENSAAFRTIEVPVPNEIAYPLRNYHFSTYIILASGLIITLLQISGTLVVKLQTGVRGALELKEKTMVFWTGVILFCLAFIALFEMLWMITVVMYPTNRLEFTKGLVPLSCGQHYLHVRRRGYDKIGQGKAQKAQRGRG